MHGALWCARSRDGCHHVATRCLRGPAWCVHPVCLVRAWERVAPALERLVRAWEGVVRAWEHVARGGIGGGARVRTAGPCVRRPGWADQVALVLDHLPLARAMCA